jgi:ABC-type polysaccharide/polyol phosphate export permease
MSRYLLNIWLCRYFWLSLVKIDLRARYRRSLIGIGWSLLRPIFMTVILCAAFYRIFSMNNVWSYAPYLLAGLACWDYIVTATKQGCQCLFQGESYIRQYPAPMAIYPLRIALVETIHFLFALVVVLGLAWYVNGFGNLGVLFCLLPTLLMLFVLVWSLALLAGFANVYFQDTQHLCDVGFQILFYATPIIYYPEVLGPPDAKFRWLVTHCNPLVPFLQLIREPILFSQVPALETYLLGLMAVGTLGCLAMGVCYWLQRQVIFHL